MNSIDRGQLSEAVLVEWLRNPQQGESRAVGRLWELYFSRMMEVARRKLGGAHRKARDEEDIALSAFKSFCLGLRGGKFASSERGLDLWPLLVTLTVNKAIDHLRRENRAKRGGAGTGPFFGERPFELSLELLLASDTAPELQLVADESMALLLSSLDASGDPLLREIALLRLEDESTGAIASRLGCTVRTVQRKLKTIQTLWQAADS